MQFSVSLPTDQVERASEFVTGDAVAEMAAAAEAAGFAACNVTDHPFPDDRWLETGGHHALEPTVALSFAAAATTTLKLLTHIYVLAYRNPFLAAKATLSLDVLSGGRLILGVASGYLRPEFGALGVDFDERNELTDEAIVAMRRAWTEDHVVFEGRHFRARGNTMRPRPVSVPHPPIWVGGNSRRAIRRAVELGQGWVPFPNPPAQTRALKTPALTSIDDLAVRVEYARAHADAVGRTEPLDVCCAPLRFVRLGEDREYGVDLLEELAVLESIGVTWVTIGFGARTRAEWLSQVASFGEEVLTRVAS